MMFSNEHDIPEVKNVLKSIYFKRSCFPLLFSLNCLHIHNTNYLLQEDFQPMAYGFKMASDVTDVRVTGMVKEVEDELMRVIKVGGTEHRHVWSGGSSKTLVILMFARGGNNE